MQRSWLLAACTFGLLRVSTRSRRVSRGLGASFLAHLPEYDPDRGKSYIGPSPDQDIWYAVVLTWRHSEEPETSAPGEAEHLVGSTRAEP